MDERAAYARQYELAPIDEWTGDMPSLWDILPIQGANRPMVEPYAQPTLKGYLGQLAGSFWNYRFSWAQRHATAIMPAHSSVASRDDRSRTL